MANKEAKAPAPFSGLFHALSLKDWIREPVVSNPENDPQYIWTKPSVNINVYTWLEYLHFAIGVHPAGFGQNAI